MIPSKMPMCQMIIFVLVILVLDTCECIQNCKILDQYCNCDNKCSLYGDCCPGHFHFNKTGIQSNILRCKPLVGFSSVWVVDKCGEKDHLLSSLCAMTEFIPGDRLKSFIPVIASDGFIYQNMFCAKCNKKAEFRYLEIQVNCFDNKPTNIEEVNALLNNGSSCYVETMFSKEFFRPCYKNLIRTCPTFYGTENNKTVMELCENEVTKNIDVISSRGKFFRNEFCCSCWNETCQMPVVSDIIRFNGFSYLLNLNQWDKNEEWIDIKSNESVRNQTTGTGLEKSVYYLSFIFTVLSMFSLLLLIIIYASQRIFHTFGGYLTICLSCCLLLMNFLILLLKNDAISSSGYCRLLGILQHFIALSNFIWMAIYALDLLQTFGLGGANKSKKKSFKTFLAYCVLGFGFAILFVGTATITEFQTARNSSIRPGYGGEFCWFTSRLGGFVWYFFPVCVFLTWNFIACVVVFYKLSKTAKECRVVQKNESSTTLWLCVRLTAVFGIGYLFQVIAVSSGVEVLIVLGSLMNCLQGCLLAGCFLWTRRVFTVVSTTITSITGTNPNVSSSQSQGTRTTKVGREGETVN